MQQLTSTDVSIIVSVVVLLVVISIAITLLLSFSNCDRESSRRIRIFALIMLLQSVVFLMLVLNTDSNHNQIII
jgi:hypothetical protein